MTCFRNDILPLKNMLYRLALRITLNREEAEDIVQDTLIKVWNRRDTWHQIDSIEAYCTAVCRNLALDRMQRERRRDIVVSNDSCHTLQEQPDDNDGPLEKTSQRQNVEIVRRLVDSLPEKQRSCLQLRDFEGKTYKEIAATLAISEEQVKVNIFRARQTIKQQFKICDNYGL